MRILYLDSRVEFLNPTRELQLALLKQVGDVTAFGPGYVSETELAAGLDSFVKIHGTFDILVVTEQVTNAAIWPTIPNLEAIYRRNHRRHFPISHLRFVPEILQFALVSQLPKVAFVMETDYYEIDRVQVETLLQFDGLVGFGEQFVRPLTDVQRYGLERFAPRANDNYARMVRAHADRVLSFPPFVSSRELEPHPGARPQRPLVAVPGASYVARQGARRTLSAAGLLAPGARHLRKAFGALSRGGVPMYSSSFGQAILRSAYRREISNSALAFADGSGLEWPVRKFFEIPAFGSALMCLPCNGFGDLGFIDGESATATTPESIVDDARQLLADPLRLGRLQLGGWNVIRQSHTVEARGPVLEGAFKRIIAGTFSGSWWERGSLVLA
jgi:hypothetical protein